MEQQIIKEESGNRKIAESQSPTLLASLLKDIAGSTRNRVLVFLAAIVGGGCSVPYRATTTARIPSGSANTSTRDIGERTVMVGVICNPGERKCEDGEYLLCTGVNGLCSCNDQSVDEENCNYRNLHNPGRFESCTQVRRRVCSISNVSFVPRDIAELVGEPVPYDTRVNALRCSDRWDSTTGYKTGSMWTHIASRDAACHPDEPVE